MTSLNRRRKPSAENLLGLDGARISQRRGSEPVSWDASGGGGRHGHHHANGQGRSSHPLPLPPLVQVARLSPVSSAGESVATPPPSAASSVGGRRCSFGYDAAAPSASSPYHSHPLPSPRQEEEYAGGGHAEEAQLSQLRAFRQGLQDMRHEPAGSISNEMSAELRAIAVALQDVPAAGAAGRHPHHPQALQRQRSGSGGRRDSRGSGKRIHPSQSSHDGRKLSWGSRLAEAGMLHEHEQEWSPSPPAERERSRY